MSKVLESRKTSNILAKKKEIELTQILSLAYVLHPCINISHSTIFINAALLATCPQKGLTMSND